MVVFLFRMGGPRQFCQRGSNSSCADPESFDREGLTLTTFSFVVVVVVVDVVEGRKDLLSTSKSGTFKLRYDGGWLGSFVIFQGIQSIANATFTLCPRRPRQSRFRPP